LAQVKWIAVDSVNQHLPKGVQLFYTNDSLDGKPNIAYYIEADLKNKNIQFDVDTTYNRRLTPTQFYEKNDKPLVIVNGTFFSFTTNQSLNVVIKNGSVVAQNIKNVQRKRKDSTVVYVPINRSAIGITKRRKADIAWIATDSSWSSAKAIQTLKRNKQYSKDSIQSAEANKLDKWKMQTAIGGGPVILQNGQVYITNEEELLFTGKNGLIDKHPRTAMGYTKNHKLIILVIQGRFPNKAEGATLEQEAKLLQSIGCIEALNLDGGGSSCMLVNGNETIQPCDKTGQRPIPAVFIIKYNKK
jgi:exopolysaccharide biosynthesis protein